MQPTDQDKTSNFYREPSIDANSYQVSAHFLEIDKPETKIDHSGHVC